MKYFSVVQYIIEQRQPFKQTNKQKHCNENMDCIKFSFVFFVFFFFALLQNLFKTKIGQEDV